MRTRWAEPPCLLPLYSQLIAPFVFVALLDLDELTKRLRSELDSVQTEIVMKYNPIQTQTAAGNMSTGLLW